MDDKMKRYSTFVYYFSFLIGLVILSSNTSYRLTSLCIYAVFVSAMIWHSRTYRDKPGRGKNLLYILLIPALCVQYFDHTRFTGFSVWILIIYAILFYGLRLEHGFIAIPLFGHIALLVFHYWQEPAPGVLGDLGVIIVPRVFMLLLVIMMQKSLAVNAENKVLTNSLRENALKLENALIQLSAYAAELESTADLRARDKLMHELHDKLGHILSTASIGAQAATVLLDKDIPSAKERMAMVTKQIQEAMKYLRQVISGETSGQTETDPGLIQSLHKLIRETEKETGVPIKHNLAELSDGKFEALSVPKRIFLYNALMEGLTNGIRHACPTRFQFFLDMADAQIRFSVWNDGAGLRDITYGYGLSKMASEAARFGGMLEISNQDGFMIKITLPAGTQTEASQDG